MNLKGGYDRDSYANSFTGQVTKHFYTHTGSASDAGSLTCEYFYMYDPNDRLVAVDCALNGGTRSALYRLSYDSYGRMQQKTFGNGLYTGTYSYNLRGWLTGIISSPLASITDYRTTSQRWVRSSRSGCHERWLSASSPSPNNGQWKAEGRPSN